MFQYILLDMSSTETSTEVTAGGKRFRIIEKIIEYDGIIRSHTFKLGGDYQDCVNANISYQNGIPIHGKLIHAEYDSSCALGTILNRGIGSVLMIKTLLRYIHSKYLSVTKFYFEDMSNIECATEENIQKAINRRQPLRKGSYIIPLPLNLLSIAYNGKTWYERYFNAEYADPDRQHKYRNRIYFLYNPEEKLEFKQFLEMAGVPNDQDDYLRDIYISSNTYNEFFNSIPKDDRCLILRPWLQQFMNNYLNNIFSNYGWVIDITKMNQLEGGKRKTQKKRRGKRSMSYYIPKGVIVHYTTYEHAQRYNKLGM